MGVEEAGARMLDSEGGHPCSVRLSNRRKEGEVGLLSFRTRLKALRLYARVCAMSSAVRTVCLKALTPPLELVSSRGLTCAAMRGAIGLSHMCFRLRAKYVFICCDILYRP